VRGEGCRVILSEAREAGAVEGPLSERIGKRSFDCAAFQAASLRMTNLQDLRLTTYDYR